MFISYRELSFRLTCQPITAQNAFNTALRDGSPIDKLGFKRTQGHTHACLHTHTHIYTHTHTHTHTQTRNACSSSLREKTFQSSQI